MSDAVVFNGLNSLDFQAVRANVVRIPEVAARLSEAQKLWDKFSPEEFGFYNFLCSDDDSFLKNIHFKSLAAAIVQVGLYDRYTKPFRRPEYLIGCSNCDSALHVAVGQKSFADLILDSSALNLQKNEGNVRTLTAVSEQPVLSGISLTEYQVYQFDHEASRYQAMDLKDMDINKLVRALIDNHSVHKFINIGPGNLLLMDLQKELALSEVQMMESVDIDPMLSWFWSSVKKPVTGMSVVGEQ